VLDHCAACGATDGMVLAFSAARGGLVCERCLHEGVPITPGAVEVLRRALGLPLAELRALPGEDGFDELDQLEGGDGRAMVEMMLALGGEDHFLDIARQALGKDVLEDLRRNVGGNKKQFVRALMVLLTRIAPPIGPGGPGANADAPPARAASPRGERRPSQSVQKDFFDE